MKTWIGLSLIGLAISWNASAELELKGSPEDLAASVGSVPGQISITASAEVEAEADRAMVRLAVTTKDRALQKAFEKNRLVRDDIIQTVASKGFGKDAVKVSRFSTTPQFGWLSKQKPDAYEVKSAVEIYVGNESELQAITAFVDTRPEITLQAISFEHTDEDNFRRKALGIALDKIDAQKKVYEEKLGVLLRARGFPANFSADTGRRPVLGDMPNYVYARKSAYSSVAVESTMAEGTPDLSQFERITYKVQLTLVFDVLARDDGR